MALVNVTHKPVTARARQFDGTVGAASEILAARPTASVSLTLIHDSSGALTGLDISGGQVGAVRLQVGDWIVFPEDIKQPAFAVEAADAVANWQIV